MKLPHSNRKRALLIVDVQESFLTEHNDYVVENIVQLLNKFSYDFYIRTIFHSPAGSIWDKQVNHTLLLAEALHTPGVLDQALADKNVLTIQKMTKSAFKGSPDLLIALKQNNITELHIVGCDTGDCVLASAHESFDLDFFTYVIEECCGASKGRDFHKSALQLLRKVNLTNNSVIEKIDKQNI
jgi:nicotinamidase-related amidase